MDKHKAMVHTPFQFLAPVFLVMQLAMNIRAETPALAKTNAAAETATARENRMAWWREARFGMFIHFGLYAIPGRGEWVQWNEQIPVEEYARLADQFTLTNFNVGAWVDTARAAGCPC